MPGFGPMQKLAAGTRLSAIAVYQAPLQRLEECFAGKRAPTEIPFGSQNHRSRKGTLVSPMSQSDRSTRQNERALTQRYARTHDDFLNPAITSDRRALNLSKVTVFKRGKQVYFRLKGLNSSNRQGETDHENDIQVTHADTRALENPDSQKDSPNTHA